jgi:hypothetical protein
VLVEEASTPSTPSGGYKKLYAKNDGKVYTLNSSGLEQEVGSGAGGGGVRNFLGEEGDAETNSTAGWAEYSDTAATSPADGTGGSATVSISASGTSPLDGDYSFVLDKPSGNYQGQGITNMMSGVLNSNDLLASGQANQLGMLNSLIGSTPQYNSQGQVTGYNNNAANNIGGLINAGVGAYNGIKSLF